MPRATPLPPDERRAAIVAATLPLLAEHGRDVSTRQIAEAAGVAEGTIFRVFDNKDALIDTVIREALDPAPTCDALNGIPRDAPLETRLGAAVAILQERLTTVFELFHSLRLQREDPRPDEKEEGRRREEAVNAAMVAVLEPDADRLNRTTAEIAQLLRAVTFALTHPFITELPHDEPQLIVDLLLHGLLRPHVDHDRATDTAYPHTHHLEKAC